MLTGGQVRSVSPSGAASAGCSGLTPKRLLTRAPSDCEDAGATDIPQLVANATAANSAILRHLPNPAAPMITCLSPIRRPWHPRAIRPSSPWGRVITAQWRRTQGAGNPVSAAKILVQQAEQQMVLPDAVDAEIAPREALAAEAAFLQHPERRRIGGDASGLDAVKIELAEQRW